MAGSLESQGKYGMDSIHVSGRRGSLEIDIEEQGEKRRKFATIILRSHEQVEELIALLRSVDVTSCYHCQGSALCPAHGENMINCPMYPVYQGPIYPVQDKEA